MILLKIHGEESLKIKEEEIMILKIEIHNLIEEEEMQSLDDNINKTTKVLENTKEVVIRLKTQLEEAKKAKEVLKVS